MIFVKLQTRKTFETIEDSLLDKIRQRSRGWNKTQFLFCLVFPSVESTPSVAILPVPDNGTFRLDLHWHKITIGAIDHFPLHVVHNQENGFEIKPILVITRVECNAEEGIHRRNNNWIKYADKIANVTVDPHPPDSRRKLALTVQIEVPAEILRAFPLRIRRYIEIRLTVIVRIKKDHLHHHGTCRPHPSRHIRAITTHKHIKPQRFPGTPIERLVSRRNDLPKIRIYIDMLQIKTFIPIKHIPINVHETLVNGQIIYPVYEIVQFEISLQVQPYDCIRLRIRTNMAI